MGTNGRGLKVTLGALLLFVAVGALLSGALIGPGMMGPGMMWGYGGAQPFGSGGIWGLAMGSGMLLTLAFWAAVIAGVVLLVRWVVGSPSEGTGAAPPEQPRDILRRRYAAGEIDQATYQRMRLELEGDAEAGVESRPRQVVGANGTRN